MNDPTDTINTYYSEYYFSDATFFVIYTFYKLLFDYYLIKTDMYHSITKDTLSLGKEIYPEEILRNFLKSVYTTDEINFLFQIKENEIYKENILPIYNIFAPESKNIDFNGSYAYSNSKRQKIEKLAEKYFNGIKIYIESFTKEKLISQYTDENYFIYSYQKEKIFKDIVVLYNKFGKNITIKKEIDHNGNYKNGKEYLPIQTLFALFLEDYISQLSFNSLIENNQKILLIKIQLTEQIIEKIKYQYSNTGNNNLVKVFIDKKKGIYCENNIEMVYKAKFTRNDEKSNRFLVLEQIKENDYLNIEKAHRLTKQKKETLRKEIREINKLFRKHTGGTEKLIIPTTFGYSFNNDFYLVSFKNF